eukprot:9824172-Alexandrium_andersonii.AAC.1
MSGWPTAGGELAHADRRGRLRSRAEGPAPTAVSETAPGWEPGGECAGRAAGEGRSHRSTEARRRGAAL